MTRTTPRQRTERPARKPGIPPSRLTFIAQCYQFTTGIGDLITPIITYFDDDNFVPVPNVAEIDGVFQLPHGPLFEQQKP